MSKKVLIICTGNSCRSIIAEALINSYLDNIKAYSCGMKPSGRVNPNAKKVLQNHNIWDNRYYSKHLDDVIDIDFDLVVTVCDSAKESCPIFPKSIPTVHIGFVDPDGKEYEAFEQTYREIKETLLPQIDKILKKGKIMSFSTADFCDKYKDELQVLELPLNSYGGVDSFNGEIITIKLNNNNHDLVKMLRDEKGNGKVVVVDVAKAFYAVVGDNLMKFAYQNGWSGIVINGYVRDIKITKTIPVGLMAIGTCPRKSFENNNAKRDIELNFGGVSFRNGEYIYADKDGIIVSDKILQ